MVNKKQYSEKEIIIMKKIRKSLVSTHRKEISDIAKELDVSQPTVRKYIKKMEDEHIIWGYTSVGDDNKIGLKTFMILIEFNQDPLQNLDELYDGQKNMPERIEKLGAKSLYVAMYHGQIPYHNITLFLAPDIETARKVQGLFYEYYGKFILHAHLSEEIITQRKILQNPNMVGDIKKTFNLIVKTKK